MVLSHEGVVHVDRFRTMFVGPGRLLVTVDVSFDPEMDTTDIDTAIEAIEEDLKATDSRVAIVYVEPEL